MGSRMAMARGDMAQLVTRVPQALHQGIRRHCIEQDISVMEFVAEALRAKLEAGGLKKRQPASKKGAAVRSLRPKAPKSEPAPEAAPIAEAANG